MATVKTIYIAKIEKLKYQGNRIIAFESSEEAYKYKHKYPNLKICVYMLPMFSSADIAFKPQKLELVN